MFEIFLDSLLIFFLNCKWSPQNINPNKKSARAKGMQKPLLYLWFYTTTLNTSWSTYMYVPKSDLLFLLSLYQKQHEWRYLKEYSPNISSKAKEILEQIFEFVMNVWVRQSSRPEFTYRPTRKIIPVLEILLIIMCEPNMNKLQFPPTEIPTPKIALVV